MITSTELFDPATNSWIGAGNFAQARSDLLYPDSVARLNLFAFPSGKIIAIGGADPAWSGTMSPTYFGYVLAASTTAPSLVRLSSAEIFDPSSRVWTATASPSVARVAPTGFILSNRNLLLVGGYSFSRIPVQSSEIYDSNVGSWSSAGSFIHPRENPVFIQLFDKKVLVSGGIDPSTRLPVAYSEIFDPAIGTWQDAGAFQTSRAGFSLLQSKDGRIVAMGGFDSSGTILASTEVSTDAFSGWVTGASELPVASFKPSVVFVSRGAGLIWSGQGSSSALNAVSSIFPFGSIQVFVEGGQQPYQFFIQSGAGMVGPDGTYVPGDVGSCRIRVQDSNSTYVDLTVVGK